MLAGKGYEAGDSPANDDLRDQATVLRHVLALHRTSPTLPELAREICENPEDFEEGDALARAVRDLAAVGLLRTNACRSRQREPRSRSTSTSSVVGRTRCLA